MNSICLSPDRIADALPVLGLDVAKQSVQAELRTNGKPVRFGFANNVKGFAQLEHILKEHNAPEVWAALEATGPYSHALALWLHGQGHRVSLLNPRRVKQYARRPAIAIKPICWMRPSSPILFALMSLQHGNRPSRKWRNCRPWYVAAKSSLSCCREKRTAWKGWLLMCAPL